MTEILGTNRSTDSHEDSLHRRDTAAVPRPDSEYGGQELPILLRIPDVASTAVTHQRQAFRQELDSRDSHSTDHNENKVRTDPQAQETVTASPIEGAGQRRRHRPGRRKAAPVPASTGWLQGWNQIIVATLIAGALLVVIVTVRGQKPANRQGTNVPTPAVGANSITAVPHSMTHEPVPATSEKSPELDLRPPAQAAPSTPAPPAPTNGTFRAPSSKLPSLNEIDPLNTARLDQTGPATTASPALPTNSASPDRQDKTESTTVRSIPPAYPSTGVAPLGLGQSDVSQRGRTAWSETVPMGTIRQARTPNSRSEYR